MKRLLVLFLLSVFFIFNLNLILAADEPFPIGREVVVRRSNGDIEAGWLIDSAKKRNGKYRVQNNRGSWKEISATTLLELNRGSDTFDNRVSGKPVVVNNIEQIPKEKSQIYKDFFNDSYLQEKYKPTIIFQNSLPQSLKQILF